MIRVRVRPENPGQYLACCGLLEIADRVSRLAPPAGNGPAGGAEGRFIDGGFELRTWPRSGSLDLAALLEVLARGSVVKDDPAEPKTTPLRLVHAGRLLLVLDWWSKPLALHPGLRMAARVKPWAANVEAADMFTSWQEELLKLLERYREDPEGLFGHRVMSTATVYGFDSDGAWTSSSAGFSLNNRPRSVSPALELLSAVGRQRFGPSMADTLEYATWCTWLTPAPARAAMLGYPEAVVAGRYRSRRQTRGSFLQFFVSQALTAGG